MVANQDLIAQLNQLDAQAPLQGSLTQMQQPQSMQSQPQVSNSGLISDLNRLDQQANTQQSLVQQPQQPQQQSELNSPGMHFIQGAGAGWGNTYGNIANMIPGVHVPQIQRPSGVASGIGNLAGSLGGFLAGGEVVDALRVGAEALPYVGRVAKSLGQPGVGGALGRIGGGAAVGATQMPGDRGFGALLGGLTSGTAEALPAAISGVSALPQAGKNLISGVTGKAAQQMLDNTYNNMAQSIEKPAEGSPINPLTSGVERYQNIPQSKTLAQDELNKQNAQNIANNYYLQKQGAVNSYDDFFKKDVPAVGYATSGSPVASSPLDILNTKIIGKPGSINNPSSVIFNPNINYANNAQKFVEPTSDIRNKLEGLLNNNPSDTGLKNTANTLDAHINNYLQSPTAYNAHILKSKLGESAADYNGFTADSNDKATARAINAVRGDLQNHILNTFRSNGDANLANRYANLNNDYKINVASYFDSPLWGAINGRKIPNVVNALKQDDLSGSADVVRQHIAQNPQQSQSVLAQALGKYTTRKPSGSYTASKPAVGESPKTGVNEFLQGYDNLDSKLKQFAHSSGVDKQMEAIRSQNAKYPLIKTALKHPLISTAVAASALSALGVPIHELL